MTVLTLNRKELEKKVGKIDKTMQEKIIMMGFTIEDINENEISIEVYPNRPDVLSMSGFSRTLLSYLGKKKPSEFKVHKPEKDYEVKIDKSIDKVKPYMNLNDSSKLRTCCAIVKNLKFDDEKIKEIIDIQEKLHLTLGRKRKKLAIGIYPLEQIKLPITFCAKKPNDIKFLPLESAREMTGLQILSGHPKGREYAPLLEGQDYFPLFIDGNGEVLSMPPIINSHKTGKISSSTKEVFIECSGFNVEYLKKTINIIVCALSDMGGEIYQMKLNDGKNSVLSPNLENQEMKFKIEDVNKTLGLDLKEIEVKKLLEKMGFGYEKEKAIVPPYRTDILHWIDLTEEIGIAYGYDNFIAEIPQISTIAKEDGFSVFKRTVSEILIGLGLAEVSSYHLTNKEEIVKVHPNFKNFIEVEESKTEYSVLRPDLLSNTMKIFYQNSDSAYPQRIFEIGRVFAKDEKSETGISEKERLSIALINENANYTELKQILDYLFRMLGKEYHIENSSGDSYIEGRCGKIISEGKEIGLIGEISPEVLKNCKIKMPTVALEIDLWDFN